MGAATFMSRAAGKIAREAFDNARRDAREESGSRGYTGTIAEKPAFVMIPLPEAYAGRAAAYADELLDCGDERVDDKWGPAGCIDLGNGQFLFFGWASE